MENDNAKESAPKVSNAEILAAVKCLRDDFRTLKKDVEEIKLRTGFKDKPVNPIPEKQNYNDDPGPFAARKAAPPEPRPYVETVTRM